MYDQPTANIILNDEKLKGFSLKSGKERMPTLTSFIQHTVESPRHSNQTRERNKGNPNWKEAKLSLLVDDMTLYIENPKDATKKQLELINELVKLQDTKLVYKYLLHFYSLTTSCQKD